MQLGHWNKTDVYAEYNLKAFNSIYYIDKYVV